LSEIGVGFWRRPGFEHRRIRGGLPPGKFQVGPSAVDERAERFGPAIVPGLHEISLKLPKSTASDFRQEDSAVAEMPIGRGRTDSNQSGDFREGKAGGAAFSDQIQRGFKQRLAQIAVVIALASAPMALFTPDHRTLDEG
jgi:hypothetical protein